MGTTPTTTWDLLRYHVTGAIERGDAVPIVGITAPDFHLSDQGSIVMLKALTDEAHIWVNDNIPDDATYLGTFLVIEHRYADDIITGITDDGLTVEAV